jgi:hypothetical protein
MKTNAPPLTGSTQQVLIFKRGNEINVMTTTSQLHAKILNASILASVKMKEIVRKYPKEVLAHLSQLLRNKFKLVIFIVSLRS